MFNFIEYQSPVLGYLVTSQESLKFYHSQEQANLALFALLGAGKAAKQEPVKSDSVSSEYVKDILTKQGFSVLSCVFYLDLMEDCIYCLSLSKQLNRKAGEFDRIGKQCFSWFSLYRLDNQKLTFVDEVYHEIDKTSTGLKVNHQGLCFSLRNFKSQWIKLKK
jgi:hypothetical protein